MTILFSIWLPDVFRYASEVKTIVEIPLATVEKCAVNPVFKLDGLELHIATLL
jgi:hypothetical protein